MAGKQRWRQRLPRKIKGPGDAEGMRGILWDPLGAGPRCRRPEPCGARPGQCGTEPGHSSSGSSVHPQPRSGHRAAGPAHALLQQPRLPAPSLPAGHGKRCSDT